MDQQIKRFVEKKKQLMSGQYDAVIGAPEQFSIDPQLHSRQLNSSSELSGYNNKKNLDEGSYGEYEDDEFLHSQEPSLQIDMIQAKEYSVIAANHTYIENLHHQNLDLEGDDFDEASSLSEGSRNQWNENRPENNVDEFEVVEVDQINLNPDQIQNCQHVYNEQGGAELSEEEQPAQEVQMQNDATQNVEKMSKTPNPKIEQLKNSTLKKGKPQQQVKENQTLKQALKKKAQQFLALQEQKHMGTASMSKAIQVDTLVIGSGPAALGFLINGLKTGRLSDLIRSKDTGGSSNNSGLAIIDEGISFGGGQLQNYGINSNTSAGGFLKAITKQVKKKGGLKEQILKQEGAKLTASAQKVQPQTQKVNSKKGQDLKKIVENAKKVLNPTPDEQEVLGPFKELSQSKLVKCLKDQFGKNIIPLSMVGHFLNYVGNNLLWHIFQLFSNQERPCKIFYPMHKALHIQLMNNGDVLTKVEKTIFNIKVQETMEPGQVHLGNGHFLTMSKDREIVYFRSKSVILGNGGQQIVHPKFFEWFPKKMEAYDRVITSDYFLKKEGFIEQMQKLANLKKKKIVIVGGSHSGFSCAWMMLNQMPAYNYAVKKKIIEDSKVLQANRKTVTQCKSCCTCAKKDSCKSCICKCFGFFQYNDWNIESQFKDFEDLKPLDFQNTSIKLLYREDIKVFYKRVQDAEKDGYTNYKKSDFVNSNGYLYSFTGLRGDAKDLYKQVISGQEKRIQFLKAQTVEQQRPYIEEADLVIWACGYQTNFLPIYDMGMIIPKCKPLSLSQKQPGTQFDVDNKCRVLLENGIILSKIFGCGIGYPVRTNDGKTQQQDSKKSINPRADSFSLYMNIVGDILIKNILPKDKKIKQIAHKIFAVQNQANIDPSNKVLFSNSPFKIAKQQKNVVAMQLPQSQLKLPTGLMIAPMLLAPSKEARQKSRGSINRPSRSQIRPTKQIIYEPLRESITSEPKKNGPTKSDVTECTTLFQNIEEQTQKGIIYAQSLQQKSRLLQVSQKSQGVSLAGIPVLNANQQRFVSKSPYVNDQVKKHIKNKEHKSNKTQRTKPTKTQDLIKASLTQLQMSENNLNMDMDMDLTAQWKDIEYPNKYYTKHQIVPTAHIKLKDLPNSNSSPQQPQPQQQTDGSSMSLNSRHTHTGIFLPKDSGVFPPIKSNLADDRYQNHYLDSNNTNKSAKKYSLREELISKVVHSQQNKLKQHRIFSGHVIQNLKSKPQLIAGRTSSKLDEEHLRGRNKSPFSHEDPNTFDYGGLNQQPSKRFDQSPSGKSLEKQDISVKSSLVSMQMRSEESKTELKKDFKNNYFLKQGRVKMQQEQDIDEVRCEIKPQRRSRISRGNVSDQNLNTQKRVKYVVPQAQGDETPKSSKLSYKTPKSEKKKVEEKTSQMVLLKKKQLGLKKDFSPVLMKQQPDKKKYLNNMMAGEAKSKTKESLSSGNNANVKIRPFQVAQQQQ